MYTEYQPCGLLSAYIDKYWVFKGKTELGTYFKILPDGCCDFIFSIGDTAQCVGTNQPVMQPYRCFFVGPMTTFSELVTNTPSVHMLGVRFHPCGLTAFCKPPLSEFTNQRISCNDLTLLFTDSFAESLCEAQTLQQQICLIERFLIHRLKDNYEIDPQIPFAVQQINRSKGRLPILQLMDEICICQRHFERKFKAYTGYTPKRIQPDHEIQKHHRPAEKIAYRTTCLRLPLKRAITTSPTSIRKSGSYPAIHRLLSSRSLSPKMSC